MASDQVQVYQISKAEQPSNKENVVLRALVGNPNRHKPQAQHPPPTTAASQEDIPASMYTLDTRYQPIPQKVLPKSAETRLYYIDAQKAGPLSAPITKEVIEEETPLPAETKPKNVNVEEESLPTIFLEPKIISQPVLYSIVGAKNLPIDEDEPISTDKEMPSPIFYTITGQPHRLTTDMSASTLNVETPVANRSPTLYSLVGSPRLHVKIQEPIKQVPRILQQPPPSLYSVVGNPNLNPKIQEPVKHDLQVLQQPSASTYSVVGRPRLQPHMQEPIKQVLLVSQQPPPSLYSIVGGPTLTPDILPTDTLNPPPLTQSVKVNSIEPVPILYTIVGETQVPNNILKENRPPLASVKKPANDAIMYGTIGNPYIPQTVILPRKTHLLQPLKQQEPQQQAQASALRTVVGKQTSPPEEDMDTLQRPILRRKTPPSIIVPTQRISRSLERRTAPGPVFENGISLPQIKRKRQGKSKEPTIPKSETTFIPLSAYERSPRSRQLRPSPRRMSPGQLRRNLFNIPQYDPLRLPDYISPYAYHPSRPYREETYNPVSLPALRMNRFDTRPRQPLSEPRHRGDRKRPYDPRTHHSLERYPVIKKHSPRLWDFEDGTQTDNDDDDDMDESNPNRKQQGYRRIRPRTPWIPVW